MRYSIVLAGSLLFVSTMARACLNDRDTLAEEAQRFPDAVRVITGRFPRNPPLYYQMRIDRESAEIAAHPNNLALYDDVAVAWDRLGNDDKALAVMARKLARMQALKTPGDLMGIGDTPWYRYYANTGTFLAHRYLRHAGKFPLSDMEKGRNLIAESIRVNPHAHFGREKVQLAVMDWIVDPRGMRLADYLESAARRDTKPAMGSDKVGDEWRKGLEGLIVLGGAWESPDAFDALSHSYLMIGKRAISEFASYRSAEILEDGGRALVRDVPLRAHPALPDGAAWSTSANFLRLRKEAEAWHASRSAYMMERLQAGRHPDTDPTFWADWHEPGPPPLVDKPWLLKGVHHTGIAWWQVLGYFLFVGVCCGACVVRWRKVGMKWDEAILAVLFGIVFTILVLGAMA